MHLISLSLTIIRTVMGLCAVCTTRDDARPPTQSWSPIKYEAGEHLCISGYAGYKTTDYEAMDYFRS